MNTLKKEQIILVNLESNNSRKVIDYLNRTNQKFYSSNDVERSKIIIKEKLNRGYKDFIICGGDGSINKFINEYQKLPLNKRKGINLGIIPCGRANDLARAINLPFNIKEAFDIIQNKKTKKIDIIQVNNSYFITGGGLGLPAEIIIDVNRLSKNIFTKTIKKILGDSIYLWITLKKFIFGYKGIEDVQDKLLAIYILNQSFIGKSFNIAPEAKNNDGYFDAKFVKIPESFLSKFKTLSKGSKGKIDELNWVIKKKEKEISIKLKESSYFMGDGELFEKGRSFNIKVIPNAINIFC
jgi:diacylglycerol kinase family enzyme